MKSEVFIQGDMEVPAFPEYHQFTNIIVRWKHRVLLIHRLTEPFADYWSIAGGAVEDGETYLQAAHRELAEETGLFAERLSPIYIFIDHKYRLESHIYLHDNADGAYTNVEQNEHDNMNWFVIDEALKLRLTPGIQTALSKLIT